MTRCRTANSLRIHREFLGCRFDCGVSVCGLDAADPFGFAVDLEPPHRDQLLDVHLELNGRLLDRRIGAGGYKATDPPGPGRGAIDIHGEPHHGLCVAIVVVGGAGRLVPAPA
jgi:hypothetical protein